MDGEGEVLGGRELVQALLEFKRIGTHIDVFLARDEAVDNLDDLRMQKGLSAGDGNHGDATFLNGGEALLGSELLLQDVGRVLHFPAAGAGQARSEERR